MAFCYDSVKQLVTENSVEDFMTASNILITFASNILNHPNESKYRRIRIANPNVQTKLLNVVGGMECLFDMGFQEIDDGEFLMLPAAASLQVLQQIKDELTREREKLQGKEKKQSTQPQSVPASAAAQSVPASAAAQNVPASAPAQSVPASAPAQNVPASAPAQECTRLRHSFVESEAVFLARIEAGMRRVMQYENPSVQQKARDTVPLEELQAEASKKLEFNKAASRTLDIRDCLLLALLSWFKQSFFRWVDTLPCAVCKGTTKSTGAVSPNSDDLRWGASRVEAHTCNTCGHVNRFPRYTNPEKCLYTRQGRCGEWADCFTLFCRALGFEARYVMDWTDHVWTEVYSESQKRWFHCDPCENICDKPLLYESGWGKKLTYVIAVSKEEIQDVTWRYSAKHNEVLARRNLCREPWLRRTIHRLWHQKIASLPSERQKQLWHRLICELVEFITNKNETAESLPGRSTGSLAWRQARGELGSAAAASVSSPAGAESKFVFQPTESERESEVIHVKYNCALNKYIRLSSEDRAYEGWQACIFAVQNIFRKEEWDWKMVYLAREEGSDYAEITWKFDLADTDLRISKLELKAETAVYENGSINFRICAGENCFSQPGISLKQPMSFDVRGCQSLSITAVLQGGKGDVAWQHTQLFRQSSEDAIHYPFEIKLILN